jgi:putative ABC transport system ATP-binding protein
VEWLKMTLIKTTKLKKVYMLGKIEVIALRGISIEIERGEFVAIMGHSGSGKSTLLNLIGLLDSPSGGSIYIQGVDTTKISEKQKVNFRLHKIGFVFQFFNLFDQLTAIENVMFPMMLTGKKIEICRKRAEKLLERVGLGDKINRLPSELSGGEQQRVAIARALVNNPSILLADEPTGNLDTKNSLKIVQLLRELNEEKGLTILMVTHEKELGEMADRIIKLKDGIVIET